MSANLYQRLARIVAIVAGIGISAAASAQINSFTIFHVQGFAQTGATLSGNGNFFTANLSMDNVGDFDGGSLVPPSPGSPVSFSPDSPPDLNLNFSSPSVPDKATLDAEFPAGTYTAIATNSSTSASQTTSIADTADAYSSTTPALTLASFNALQGMNPSQSVTLNFNNMVPDAAANEADVFFTVHDASFNTLFDGGFLPSNTTSVTIPTNALAPNTSYTFNLIFSDRINTTNLTDGVFDTQGFDLSTTGAFTTGDVPEPASLTLLAIGATAMILRHRSTQNI